jgi:RsiW-degrading membrane proteinase PrsW (M82 family)
LLRSPVLRLFIWFFRDILPGAIATDAPGLSFPVQLIGMFFGAGLMEELLKALPLFLILGLGRGLRPRQRDHWGIVEPLDGILLGAASAIGFTMLETLGQYVPAMVQDAQLQAGLELSQLRGLQLLIPRLLGTISGHMAYSGYFGYFIGLSVLRPTYRWQILIVGYVTASGLHALWNTMGGVSPVLLAIVGMLSYAFLAASIVKARSLSPNRTQNFATRLKD